jgi:transmembrane 9 superfamily member 2/4
MAPSLTRLLTTCLALFTCANAFYLPGAAPNDYHEGDRVELFVNALTPMLAGSSDAKLVGGHVIIFTGKYRLIGTSINVLEISHQLCDTSCPKSLSINLLSQLILDDYYHPRFHFCQPEGGPKARWEGLGSVLFGDRIFNSPYDVSSRLVPRQIPAHPTTSKITMLKNNGTCTKLCDATIPKHDVQFVNDRIREDYALNWLIDGLPAAEIKRDLRTNETFFDMGFNLGKDEGEYAEKPAFNNHYDIFLRYVVVCLLQRPEF